MARARMFNVALCNELRFLQLSSKAQNLYFQLSLRADDDGFVGAPGLVARMINAGNRQLTELTQAGYFYIFPSGCGVCMDWHRNNAIRKDRHQKTVYQQELSMLELGADGYYTLKPNDNQLTTKPQPDDNPGKDRSNKNMICESRTSNVREGTTAQAQTNPDMAAGTPEQAAEKTDCKEACPDLPPSLEEVKSYCRHCKLQIDPVEFWNYYNQRGWKINGSPITGWRKLANYWNKTEGKFPEPKNEGPWTIIGCVL